jgi:hypothetical protein
MQRMIIDTNVYADWINDGKYEAVIFQRNAIKHLSAVVIMELAEPFLRETAGWCTK